MIMRVNRGNYDYDHNRKKNLFFFFFSRFICMSEYRVDDVQDTNLEDDGAISDVANKHWLQIDLQRRW
jgi:hypothetical protein